MRRVFVCVLLILFGSGGYAQNNSLLWEIKGKNLTAPSYIFGTFHLMCKEDFNFENAIKERLKSTKQFYGEIDLSNPNIQQEMIPLLMMQGKTIQAYIGADSFKKCDSIFTKITGISLQLFSQFKPFMAQSMLAINTISCSDKIQPETKFMEYASALKIPIKGLETVADQLKAVDESSSISEQIDALKKTLLGYDSVQRVMHQLLQVYKQKNVDSIYNFMKTTGIDDAFETALLVKRNRSWIPVMIKAFTTTPSFFAVGAGHLGGDQGILALLRKEGYELKPIVY